MKPLVKHYACRAFCLSLLFQFVGCGVMSSADRSSTGARNQFKQKPSPQLVAGLVEVNEKMSARRENQINESKLTLDQVRTIVAREFGGLLQVDEMSVKPGFLTGDFNGDGVEDIFVVARLSQLPTIEDNSELPFQLDNPPGTASGKVNNEPMLKSTMSNLARFRNELVQIVIHGAPSGWAGSITRQQKFVLLHAMDYGTTKMKTFHGSLKLARAGDEQDMVTPPSLVGDAILLLGRDNSGTALYWDGSRYRWYPVDNAPRQP